MGRTLDFREWLESMGVLPEYIRGYLAGELVNWDDAIADDYPMGWLNWQNWSTAGTVPRGAACLETWEEIEDSWDNQCQNGPFDEVVMGMPLEDKLGMALLLAELEERDERGVELQKMARGTRPPAALHQGQVGG